MQRTYPGLIRADWNDVKVEVMRAALRAKLTRHAAVRELLLSSAGGGWSRSGRRRRRVRGRVRVHGCVGRLAV